LKFWSRSNRVEDTSQDQVKPDNSWSHRGVNYPPILHEIAVEEALRLRIRTRPPSGAVSIAGAPRKRRSLRAGDGRDRGSDKHDGFWTACVARTAPEGDRQGKAHLVLMASRRWTWTTTVTGQLLAEYLGGQRRRLEEEVARVAEEKAKNRAQAGATEELRWRARWTAASSPGGAASRDRDRGLRLNVPGTRACQS